MNNGYGNSKIRGRIHIEWQLVRTFNNRYMVDNRISYRYSKFKMASKTRVSNQERYYFHNNLSILLKAVEGKKTTVDFRNESSIIGLVEQVDGYMNIVMKNCVFVDPRGSRFNYDTFFVHSRNIRYVHIPPQIQIIPAIEDQLKLLKERPRENENTQRKMWKMKRVQQKQREDLSAVQEILRAENN